MHSGEILRIIGTAVLKSFRLEDVSIGDPVLEGSLSSSPGRLHSRFLFTNDLLKFSTSHIPSFIFASINDVRLPLSDPNTDGTLVWQLLKMASLGRPSSIAIQVEQPSEGGKERATIVGNVTNGKRLIHVSFEVKECSTSVKFINVGLMECLELPITGIWCTSHQLDFTPILQWLLAPHTKLSQHGGRFCPFLGNLEFYRCDDASEELLNSLERRILDFDEERSREPSGQSNFNLWVEIDDISAIPIFHRAVLLNHCKRWKKPAVPSLPLFGSRP